jgi:lysophospholipase L1-like esterase
VEKIMTFSGFTHRISPSGNGVAQSGVIKQSPDNPFNYEKQVFVTNRNDYFFSSLTAASDNYSRTYRLKRWSHKTLTTADHRLVYANSRLLASGDTAATNAITLKASVEGPNGTSLPVFFGGKREVTIEAGGFVTSDPVGMVLPPNTAFFVRTRVTVALTGHQWPLGGTLLTTEGETWVLSDQVDNVTTMATNAGTAFGPVAIRGAVGQSIPSVVIIGGSSTIGQSDIAVDAGNPQRDMGYLPRWLTNEVCYLKVARGNHRLDMVLPDSRRMSLIAALKPSHVIVQMGYTELFELSLGVAGTQARLLEVWQAMAALGAKVFQVTITPAASSSDSFATLANQTPFASSSLRLTVNDWIKSMPAPLSGVLDVAALVQDGTDPTRWKVTGGAFGYTADGTHLSPAAYQMVAASLNKAILNV